MVILVVFLLLLAIVVNGDRLYQDQFPLGSELIEMPRIVLFSVYMGEINYIHLPFLLTSMKWNPRVQFEIINIYNPEKTNLSNWKAMLEEYPVPNLHVEYVTISQFSDIVADKLNIRVPFDDKWYYKMCDFKPTLPFLFPHLASNETYKYWGYADLDVVWGNISRWSYLFTQGRPFIISGWYHTTGALNMFINEDWTRNIFRGDPKYVELLQNITYRNLDENGIFLNSDVVVDGGSHAMMSLEQNCPKCKEYINIHHEIYNRGKNPQDTLFLGEGESSDWAGHHVWTRGTLSLPAGSVDFPPGRQMMFFHVRRMELKFDEDVRKGIIEDMLTYGYTLPSFVPLFTRFACRTTQTYELDNYQPYEKSCFASKLHHMHNVNNNNNNEGSPP